MKKGLLLCSGGMSTTMIAKKLDELYVGKLKWEAKGTSGGGDWEETLSDYSVVLVSPQIKFKFDEIKQLASSKNVPTLQIEPAEYIVTKAPQLKTKIDVVIKW